MERKKAMEPIPSGNVDNDGTDSGLPSSLQKLLTNVPQFPRSPFTPGIAPAPAGRAESKDKQKEKGNENHPQL